MAGLTAEDRIQIAVGYVSWTAGVGFQLGCERFGLWLCLWDRGTSTCNVNSWSIFSQR